MLAAAMVVAGGRAWSQVPSTPAEALQRAAALVQARNFMEAETVLRALLSVDPANRRAQEMLAFALESAGDLRAERQLRTSLAAQFPDDARIQTDFGRVLERSGEEGEALRAYVRARELTGEGSAPELDAAIERMRGRTAVEIETPLEVTSDPNATASSVQAGAAIPMGSGRHVALLGTRSAAEGRTTPDATTSDQLALTFVQRMSAGASWEVGPRLQRVSPRGGAREELGVGGSLAARSPLGPFLEAEGKAEFQTPWDEAPVTMLHGGRTTAAEGRLYAHGFSRHLLLQAAARRRELSILAADPDSTRRPRAWESLWIAGADLVLWSRPGAAVRGEMLDESLVAPTTLSSALTLAYRHYDVTTQTTPEFAAIIGLVPRGSVDEASVATTMAPPRGRVGLELRAGLARDAARDAQSWRAGASVVWAPTLETRLALGYEGATEMASGLAGQRRAGWLSFHANL